MAVDRKPEQASTSSPAAADPVNAQPAQTAPELRVMEIVATHRDPAIAAAALAKLGVPPDQVMEILARSGSMSGVAEVMHAFQQLAQPPSAPPPPAPPPPVMQGKAPAPTSAAPTTTDTTDEAESTVGPPPPPAPMMAPPPAPLMAPPAPLGLTKNAAPARRPKAAAAPAPAAPQVEEPAVPKQPAPTTTEDPFARPKPEDRAVVIDNGVTEEPALEVAQRGIQKAFASLGVSVPAPERSVRKLSNPRIVKSGDVYFDQSHLGGKKDGNAIMDVTDGVRNEVSINAQASEHLQLNPTAFPTTLIHEAVHFVQQGNLGGMAMYEAMTEIMAAMAFDQMRKENPAVTGSYCWAPDYAPWVLFVKNVVSKKIPLQRLAAAYARGGMDFPQLAAELGFRPDCEEMRELEKALVANNAAALPDLSRKILHGVPEPEKKRPEDKTGNPEKKADDPAPIVGAEDAWKPSFDQHLEKNAKGEESHGEIVMRLQREAREPTNKACLKRTYEYLKEVEAAPDKFNPNVLKKVKDAAAYFEHSSNPEEIRTVRLEVLGRETL